MSKTIAIIGAGMAGLSCAMKLKARGLNPVLFDKGRGPGGRMATRRAHIGTGEASFDHGAQYFTARDPRFAKAVEGWRSAGYAAPWPAAGEDAYVGTPGMNAPIKQMAQFFNIVWGKRIDGVLHDEHTWHLRAGDTIFRAQQLVCAIPAEQAAELLEREAPDFAAQATAVQSKPCWALMARFADRLDLADTFRGEAVAWAARNSAKPGRGEGEDWVIHASPEWSAEHLELDKDTAAPKLLAAFFAEAGITLQQPLHSDAHRWRYAMVGKADGAAALWDPQLALGVCGDWLAGPRVENAFLSGLELAALMTE
ncbi:NAD(P)/FAD-dependent oxidoreductase [Parerythrobacter aestuarii]|uniref:NAD(P)/FAD-dependent oxidoreductase n=1 Tax=Parerythrobacter aestuarii TaxID=3020909 RepID=UPI0024DEBB64|nr:FAD-dependent oxidoreductase [Parerythrobacter aestuarii]